MKNQEVKDAMIARILDVWPDATIYQEEVPQDFATPSFCVLSMGVKHTGALGPRATREYAYVMHYFASETADMRTECESVGDTLLAALEYIDGKPAKLRRGIGLDYDVSDQGVLTLHATYRVHLIRDLGPEAKMEYIIHKETVRDASKDPKPGSGGTGGSGNAGGSGAPEDPDGQSGPGGGNPCRDCTAFLCVTTGQDDEIRGEAPDLVGP